MNQSNNGGPAFPSRGGMMFYVPEEARGHVEQAVQALDQQHAGISARDYFAATAPAMPGDFDRKGKKVEKIIDAGNGQKKFATVTEWESPAQHAARWAYEFADAMLALRGAA